MEYVETKALLETRHGKKGDTVFCEELGGQYYWKDFTSDAPHIDEAFYIATGNGGQTRWVSNTYTGAYKNKIINGNFDQWQRSTTQTNSGYGSADRWVSGHLGSTKVVNRQAFSLAQTDVPNNPEFYHSTVVTSVAGAGNLVDLIQKIENVKLSNNQTYTLSFWAKADASKDIAVEGSQHFGTGGSPSAIVTNLNTTTFSLTTSWQKFTMQIDYPSISGKTLGTDNNDFFQILFWFDAGSNWDSRSNSLGQQSGTFDIAQVQLEQGISATNFEILPPDVILRLCKRYFDTNFNDDPRCRGGAHSATALNFYFEINMRIAPQSSHVTIGVLTNAVHIPGLVLITPSTLAWVSSKPTMLRMQATYGAVTIRGDMAFLGTDIIKIDVDL